MNTSQDVRYLQEQGFSKPYRFTLFMAFSVLFAPALIAAPQASIRSPWDGKTVALTAAPYTCPAAPHLGADLTTDGFYRLDDPTHSIIDPVRQEAYRKSSEPVKDAGMAIVQAADAYRTTGSQQAAHCAMSHILTLAKDHAFSGSMSSNQAYYVQGWVAGAIAIAYLKVRDTERPTAQQMQSITVWLQTIGQQTIDYYDGHGKSGHGDSQNNHLYWAGVELAAIGAATDSSKDLNLGLNTYKIGVAKIRPDGTLPLEMARGARALHYHLYALAPLVLLAEFGAANQIDLYGYADGAIHRLVDVSIAGLKDPGSFVKATGVQQEVAKTPSGDQIGWAPPYVRRFPSAILQQYIVAAPSLSVYILPLFIANGVTGVRDMGSALDPVLKARDDIAAHHFLGPRMVVSGPMLDGPKSHYKAAIAIVTPDDGRNAVDMLKNRGVDFIKIQSGVPREAYFAIAEEAKKLDIEFEGHVPDAIRASEAVSVDQRTFEHLIGIFEASSADEDKYLTATKTPGMFLETYDPVREARIIQLLADHHVWQCPTLFWERGQWLVDAIDYTKDPDLAYAGHTWVTRQWPAAQKGILQSLDTDPLAVREKFVDHELGIVRRLHTANVPFLAGTDTPAGVDVIPGVSLHLELQRFVAAGFTPLEALQTATLNPAEFYNKLKDFGNVKTGRIADLVLLKANPQDNIANTRKIAGVIADGHYLSQQDLDKLRARIKHTASTK